MATETFDLVQLGQSSIIKDDPRILDKGREFFQEAVAKTIKGYQFFAVTTEPQFQEVLHQGPECAFRNDQGEWIEFPYRHYHLTATWDVCHDLLVRHVQKLFNPFHQIIDVRPE